jgi:hypothetical protein
LSAPGVNGSSFRVSVLYRRSVIDRQALYLIRTTEAWESIRKAARRLEDATAALQDEDLELARVCPELHIAVAGDSRMGETHPQRFTNLGDHGLGVTGVKEDAAGEIAQHPADLRDSPGAAVIGEMKREQELVVGHDARFYSDRRSKSTRARAQSAAI